MSKILIAVTSVSKYPELDRATGLWLGEAVHFADEFYKNGYEIDFVSPKGGYTPIDPESLKAEVMTELDWKYYQDTEFMNKLGNTLKASEINPDLYDVIYYAGGHGVIWDFKDDKNLQEISHKVYTNHGIVSSVCHGAIGLLNIKDSEDNFLINGKELTGFSNSEEIEAGLDQHVPYLTEDELKNRGAKYVKEANWSSYAVQDDRLVTGQNPQSGQAVAIKIIEMLNKQD
ncbi:type 1 glutamine amidotransferase domain-containing protein [Mammaliicoccus stepanovicii]|uniref:ThiJ/PfpI family protein n=1 Tax=Mammaliicoccus stepanovicii TaxID=643214 RepID=A0A239YW48_9STAP|nr:type 1 glutamine amidotransferase domain-containing protein [Mammaliicoccus stepanovicii]PNZ75731.1 type 1 glutamine amidotransferase domain-containing protein [Mammaliicoccus stepanovicii]GGI40679.1 thiazole biosynthesis protein ThiJ [Mammaliicoccus stepanovicii]SNV62616.1 ThiJ/PfpI family protein [Mammaliicoccus stepanovicii]